MKKTTQGLLIVVVIGVVAFGLAKVIPTPQGSAPSQSLAAISALFPETTSTIGAATTYDILASTYTNTTAGTTVNGDVGFTTGAPVRPAGLQINYGSGAPYSTAGTDEGAALSALAALPCTFTFTPGPINLSTDTTHSSTTGTYAPGVYCSTGAMDVGGPLTLNGSGTYVFRPAGALTSDNGSIVALAGGASECNVFWTPTQATTLGQNTTFVGTDIDDSGITIGANTTWTGRALAFGGTVVTDTDTINLPVCAGPYIAPIPPVVPSTGGSSGSVVSAGSGRIVPLIGIVKVPTPLALPAGSGPVTYHYTVWNVGGQQPLDNVTVTDDKCAQVTLVSGDLNGNGKLDPGERWNYSCTTTLSITTTNTAVATGYSDDSFHQATIATALATVVVGGTLPPPLIDIVKVPNRLNPFPFGGGNVTYTYTVTNPGVVAMSNVTVTDNKCAPVSTPSGDTNGNNLLDPGESWVYTCQTSVSVSTNNTATALGNANGFTATGYAFATVLVSVPGLPNTGYPPKRK